MLKFATLLRIACVCVCAQQYAWASGGYTTPGSRALGDSNTAADMLLAGDTKALLKRDSFEAAVAFNDEFPGEPGIVSGALLNRAANSTLDTNALICVHAQVVSMTLRADGTHLFDVRSLKNELGIQGPRDLRCAVNERSGDWIAVNLKNGLALYNGSKPFQLAKANSNWTHTVSLSDAFLVLGANGRAVRIKATESALIETQDIKAPWADLEVRDTLAARGMNLLRAGDAQLSLVSGHFEGDSLQWSQPEKISVSPCSESGGCGVWLGVDGRWFVAGSWGSYVGKGNSFSRLKTPLLVGDATSPGVALVPEKELYLIVGDIDSDIARLPDHAQLERFSFAQGWLANSETRGKHSRRYAVWLKGSALKNDAELFSETEHNALFSYSAHERADAPTGDVVIFEGTLPAKWPSNWAAAEEQVDFAELSLANEWTPALAKKSVVAPSRVWWSEAAGFKPALELIKKSTLKLSPVQIAVVDSGADVDHPALSSVLSHNANEILNNAIDDDGNGLVDDDVGYDFIAELANPIDLFGHGTHVAGLLNNIWSADGLAGGAYNARLRLLRALDSKGKSNSIDLARALAAAVRGRADIINCSWGGGPETQILRDAFAAAQKAEILVFSSAGNDALDTDKNPPVPKKFPGVVSIGASTQNQSRARFSNWGERSVFMFAPGTDIVSTLPGGRLGEKSGTSMASPIAASTAALLLGVARAQHPEWSRAQQNQKVLDSLCAGSDKSHLAGMQSKCGSLSAFGSLKQILEGVR
ncbi:hypothetical protein EBU99_02460 [bacterium]|nr:hypothetical protein [bacterium]